jgi:hypothetical protein
MDKVQKHNSFNTNTPSSESYRNYLGKGGSIRTSFVCVISYCRCTRMTFILIPVPWREYEINKFPNNTLAIFVCHLSLPLLVEWLSLQFRFLTGGGYENNNVQNNMDVLCIPPRFSEYPVTK